MADQEVELTAPQSNLQILVSEFEQVLSHLSQAFKITEEIIDDKDLVDFLSDAMLLKLKNKVPVPV